jgi:hypothetical protein
MHRIRSIGFVLGALALAACADKNSDTNAAEATATTPVPAAAPKEITVHAKDYAFTGIPDTIESGVVTFKLVQDGPAPEIHHIDIMRFKDGHTMAQYADSMKAGKSPTWAESVGGPNVTSMPGVETQATVQLEPGAYTAICFVPGPDGVPHAMKGMVKDFYVKPSTTAAAAMPAADVTIRLADYNFNMPTLTAGHHVIRVENDAAQDHEIVIVKLDAGKTPDDVLKFVETMKGPPPGAFVGGVSGVSHGLVDVFPVDLAPGDYAFMCFVPDAKDGKPHAVHGMKQLVHVS